MDVRFNVRYHVSMTYRVAWSNRAERQLRRLDRHAQGVVQAAAAALADDPRPRGTQKLRGRRDHYRIRVGIHYRIVYTITERVRLVEIVAVGSREDIY